MNKSNRVREIFTAMSAFSKGAYPRSEYLPELLKLQNEAVTLTFNLEHAETANLRIYDVCDHFETLNKSLMGAADEELAKFQQDARELSSLIKSSISGLWGETQVLSSLKALPFAKRIVSNVELGTDELHSEIDAILITQKGIFIIEAKNKKRDVLISENGELYKFGNISKYEGNLAERLRAKEQLLKEVLECSRFADVPMHSVVVFANTRITIANESEIKICFPGELRHTLDEFDLPDLLSDSDMDELRDMIENAQRYESYPPDFNAERFKLDFATLMATLEEASAMENAEEPDTYAATQGGTCKASARITLWDEIKDFVSNIDRRQVGRIIGRSAPFIGAGLALVLLGKGRGRK